jgi:hypothetical protein
MARVNLRRRGIVYFATEPSGLLVKIGFTNDYERRLKQLRRICGTRIEIIAWYHGTLGDEQALHAALLPACVRGEWFWLSRVRHVVAAALQGAAL